MKNEIIHEKLESLRRCLGRVRERCPDSPEQLAADADAQDIVSLNLTRAVQLSVDIASHLLATRDSEAPATMGETFEKLGELGVIDAILVKRMRAAVGFRNIAVHSYREIDWNVTFAICGEHLSDFEAFGRAVITAIEDSGA